MSTYNQDITNEVRLSAKKKLNEFGVKEVKDIEVPGAFEIPVTISRLTKNMTDLLQLAVSLKVKQQILI